jgi:hypothetical protein
MVRTSLFLCVTTLLLSVARGEVLLEVEFDLHALQTLPDGYSAGDSINAFLLSTDMKWLRHFINTVSSKPGEIRMRTSHLMFKDHESWAIFQQENAQKFNALFEHFWINSRRTLWNVAAPEAIMFPKTVRTEGIDAGYIFQVFYSITPGHETEVQTTWNQYIKAVIADLEGNAGFLERTHFTAGVFQIHYTNLIQYEFSSMKSLSSTMFGPAYTEMFNKLREHLAEHVVKILTPGADEAMYWPAQGADKAPDGELSTEASPPP